MGRALLLDRTSLRGGNFIAIRDVMTTTTTTIITTTIPIMSITSITTTDLDSLGRREKFNVACGGHLLALHA